MTGQFRVLIASASAGTGHMAAAEALRVAVQEAEPSAAVEHVDVLRLGPSWVRAAYSEGFELLAGRAPRLWRELYTRTDGEVDAARWGAAAQRILFPPFHHLVNTGRWDVVLCTHFLPCQLAAGREGAPPFALVATDFTLHRYWAQQRVSRFFVATESMAAEVRRRLQGAVVSATGIPIHPRFTRPGRPDVVRASLGLRTGEPMALVMGGGLGIGVEATARAVVGASAGDLQVVVVTGSNARARDGLGDLAGAHPRVRVLGRADNVQDLMSAADLVITKPGGLTTSEALALGKPLLLTRAIPGHEDGNAEALVRAGAALYAPEAPRLRELVVQCARDLDLRARMGQAALRLGRPSAARDIVTILRRDVPSARVA